MGYDRCPNCMKTISVEDTVCPHCKFDIGKYEVKPNCLPPFTVLQNKYTLGRTIGIGGFGITYIGWDMNLKTYIAIKEYYPSSFASRDASDNTTVLPHEASKDVYAKGMKRYVEEAQNLSKFYQLQGIVSVKDFFYENETAYIVMEYVNGINLKEYLNNAGGKLDEETVLSLMKPALESLYQIHNSGLIHRDISPDNIMVTTDGKIKLIDFGSARGNSVESEKTYTVILKHGYAPSEQYYAKGYQGPWTDIYSLCATMYKMLTGQVPPNSIERMENDEYKDPAFYGVYVSPRTTAVLRKGLAIRTSQRYQNIGELLEGLYGSAPIVNNQQPAPSPAAYSNPAVMSMQTGPNSISVQMIPGQPPVNQQSMYISPTQMMNAGNANNNKKKDNNNLKLAVILGIGILAIVAIVIVIVLSVGKKKPEKENVTTTMPVTTGDVTDASTDASTDEPVEHVLTDDWRDQVISIDGAVYELPMPYLEFEALGGWAVTYDQDIVPSGNERECTVSNDRMEMDIVTYNYNVKAADITETYVIGISIDPTYANVPSDAAIEMAGGIKYKSSMESDIIAAYGEPEDRYERDDGSIELTYASSDTDSAMYLVLKNGVLTQIKTGTSRYPNGVTFDASMISTEPNVYVQAYQAPTEPSTDKFDDIFCLNGVYYQLPCPLSQFTANGWTYDDSNHSYLTGNSSDSITLMNGETKMYVELTNYSYDSEFAINTMVTEISVKIDDCFMDMVFPGNIHLGDDRSVYDNWFAGYPEEDTYYYDYTDSDVYSHYNRDYSIGLDKYVRFAIGKESNTIIEYSYENLSDLN